jgi:hypothetical protein
VVDPRRRDGRSIDGSEGAGALGPRLVEGGLCHRIHGRVSFLRATSKTMVNARSSAMLDAMRELGDPPMDEALRAYLAQHGPASLGAMFAMLGRPDGEPPILRDVPPPQRHELGDRATLERGQRFFSLYSPEILLALGSCSLPMTYAAGNGVQVIARTERLGTDPTGRLRNTARMVGEVMIPGSLEPGRAGWRSARKVRLVHAIARLEVQSMRDRPWNPAWGVPVNQEDMAGTLLSFSVAVLQAVRGLGARISRDEADAYVVAWSAVGRLLGLRPELLVGSEEEGRALFSRIAERQFRPTPEGRELAGILLRTNDRASPLPGSSTAWLHYFMRDPLFGQRVVDLLGVPPPNWTRWVVALEVLRKRTFFAAMDRVPWGRQGRSLVARYLVDRLVLRDA